MIGSDQSNVPLWPRFLGDSPLRGRMRVRLQDFRVEELPLIHPSGEGSHLWLFVEKRGANTDWIAQQLAKAAGVAARDVGYAGMKDRHAVTRQWFSMPAPVKGEPAWREWNVPDATILEAHRHSRKLQRGVLKGNRFEIVLRDLEGGREEMDRRLGIVRNRGLPNYFGAQRFGSGGSNVREAMRSLGGGRRLPRAKRSIYLSALRGFLFNHVLAQRVRENTWDRLLDGEIAMLDGTHSLFHCELPDEDLVRRCNEFDLHPTGPLPGEDGMLPRGAVGELESRVLSGFGEIVSTLQGARVEADRRSLRVLPRDLAWTWGEDAQSSHDENGHGALDRDATIRVKFSLPPGAYATAVLDEIVAAELASSQDRTHMQST